MAKAAVKESKGTKVKLSKSDRTYYAIVYTIVTILTITVLYPVINVVACSFSSGDAVSSGQVLLWPVDFTLIGYKQVLAMPDIAIGFRNSIFYVVCSVINTVVFNMLPAFPMSRRNMPGYRGMTIFFLISMYFGGGLIPTYLLYRDIGYVNTIWAIIVPGSFGVYQMIVNRTFINSNIPMELVEATKIDGCRDSRFFVQFVFPLCKPIIAVMALNSAVGQWNSYMSAHIYLQNQDLYPLQTFLREVLVMSQIDIDEMADPELYEEMKTLAEIMKYALIVVATAPIMCIYPFLQKYFVQGVMIGSLKG